MGSKIEDPNKLLIIDDQSFVLRAHFEPRIAEAFSPEVRIRVKHVNSGKVWMESDIDKALARIRGSLTQIFFPESN